MQVVVSTAPALPEKEKSAELAEIMQHQKQVQDWTHKVNKRIFELEEQYLEETTLGNIVRGWDQDAKSSKKALIKDKKRLFSLSSVTGGGRGRAGVFYAMPQSGETRSALFHGQ
jgi:hypothetical protein